MDNFGVNRLAQVMQSRTNQQMNVDGLTIEFGTILSDFSLKPDTSEMNIPAGAYYVLEHLTMKEKYSTEEADNHRHEIKTPAPINSVKAGDRVLINWFGSDPIVIGVITRGTELKASG